MTRPIYEPTLTRTDAVLGYGSDQLFRRPAPRTDGGNLAWARRRVYAQGNQSITSGSETNVTLDDYQTSDAAVFAADDVGSQDGIKVLVAGLYSIEARLYWSQWPDSHEMIINGIDPDAFAGYSIHASTPNNTFSNAGSLMARLQLGQILYMTVYHTFGSGRNLFGGAGAGGGSFFELVRIGDVTTTDTDWA